MLSVRNSCSTKSPKIRRHPQRISKIKPHIDKCNRKDITFPVGIDEYKKFEKNNGDIALNILYASPHEKKISLVYKSKYNRKRRNQVVLLMITDDEQQDNIEKWHYIALKSEIDDDGNKRPTQCLSALYRGVTSNHNGDFYCLGYLHSNRTDNALKTHERLYGKHDYCKVNMPSKDAKI